MLLNSGAGIGRAVALSLLLGIVWWTMFAGRRRGEPPRTPEDGSDAP